MKKLIAIFFLTIYLFNLSGYFLLFDYFINKADEQFAAHLDDGDYSDDSLTEIKIPLQMPYIHNQLDYERWDGSIELNGIQYNYVKRKVYNDTLYLLCLPNIHKTELHNAKTAYAASITDINTGDNKKPGQTSLKKIVFENDYDQQNTEFLFCISAGCITLLQYLQAHITNCYISCPSQPPEYYCL